MSSDVEWRSWDLSGLRADGSEFPVEIGLNPLETDQGLMFLGTIVDITERKQAQDALQMFSRLLIEAQEEERRRIARELHTLMRAGREHIAFGAARLPRVSDVQPVHPSLMSPCGVSDDAMRPHSAPSRTARSSLVLAQRMDLQRCSPRIAIARGLRLKRIRSWRFPSLRNLLGCRERVCCRTPRYQRMRMA